MSFITAMRELFTFALDTFESNPFIAEHANDERVGHTRFARTRPASELREVVDIRGLQFVFARGCGACDRFGPGAGREAEQQWHEQQWESANHQNWRMILMRKVRPSCAIVS